MRHISEFCIYSGKHKFFFFWGGGGKLERSKSFFESVLFVIVLFVFCRLQNKNPAWFLCKDSGSLSLTFLLGGKM